MSDRRQALSSLRRREVVLSLKDTLRLLRYSVRRGRSMIDAAPSAIPAPLGAVARGALSDFDQVADRVNDMAGYLSHRFLDAVPDGADDITLAEIETLDTAEIAFAHAAYRALKRALRHLGADDALVSEVRAAEAFKAAIQARVGDRIAQAAALALGLIERGAIRGASAQVRGGATKAQVATFALALWLLAERDDDLDGAEELLEACCAMAAALSGDLARAMAHEGASRERALTRLVSAYVDNI